MCSSYVLKGTARLNSRIDSITISNLYADPTTPSRGFSHQAAREAHPKSAKCKSFPNRIRWMPRPLPIGPEPSPPRHERGENSPDNFLERGLQGRGYTSHQ